MPYIKVLLLQGKPNISEVVRPLLSS